MFLLRLLKHLIKTLLVVIAVVVAIPILGLAYGFLTTDSLDATRS